MITTFHGKKSTGMLAILPENEYDYDEETAHFADLQTRRLKRIMGFGKRRAAKADTTSSDFCKYGLTYLLEQNLIKKEEIGAVIVLGLTPDYFVPHNSNIIHGQFGLAEDVLCMDIPQGCCGFMMGLMQACLLLDHLNGKKAVVFTADVLNRKHPEAKLSVASFGGDAGTITVVENDASAGDIHFCSYNDGANREALIMHAGGWKMPRSAETAIPRDIGDGTMKPYDAIWMNGSMVFNFVQKQVPLMFDKLLEYAGKDREEIDVCFFHQPNKFMLQKLAQRIGMPFEKVPMDIVGKYGNSSGSTIPVTVTDSYGERLEREKVCCCLAGFGAGLTWDGAVTELGNLTFCRQIISNL